MYREGQGVHGAVVELDAPLGVDDDAHAARGAAAPGLLRGAVGQAHGAVGVAEQGEFEGEAVPEAGVAGPGVEADPEDAGVFGVEVVLESAEPAALQRSARGGGAGIEPEDEVAAGVVGQGVAVAFLVFD